MTKQEEIREGIAQSIFERFTRGYKPWEKCTPRHKEIFLKRASLILSYLHSQGVVLKVERELPYISLEQATEHDTSEPWCAGNFTDSLQAFGKKAQQDMLSAKFVAVEPLVKKK